MDPTSVVQRAVTAKKRAATDTELSWNGTDKDVTKALSTIPGRLYWTCLAAKRLNVCYGQPSPPPEKTVAGGEL